MGKPLSIIIVSSDQEEAFHVVREVKAQGFSPLYQIISKKSDWDSRIHEEDWDAILVSYRWNSEVTPMSLLDDLHFHGLDIPFIILASEEDFPIALQLMQAGASDIIDSKTLFRLTQVLERERRELVFRREKEITQNYLEGSLNELQFQKYALDQANIVSITDANGIITYVNEKLVKISGFSKEELIGNSHRILKSQDKTKEEWRMMWDTISQGMTWVGEIKNTKKDGSFYFIETTIVPFRGEDGSIFQYIAISKDITDRKLAEDQLLYDAFYDVLTDLPNRALFLARVEQRIFEFNTKSIGYPILISLNIDNFKRINHSLGTEAGDFVLKAFADRISKFCGLNATISRLGADTFAILAIDFLSVEDAGLFIGKLKEHLKELIEYNGYEIFLTSSFGLAGFGLAGREAEELLRNAEIAMFHSKELGVGSTSSFNHSMKEKIQNQLEIQNDLAKGLERREFLVFYQPIYDIATKQIVHWEALVRWKHPKKGMVSPADFIPMAENSGFILPLTKFVLEESGDFIKAMELLSFKRIGVAINLSPQVFVHQNIFNWVVELKESKDIPFQSIQMEITESLAMKNMAETTPILANLQDLGVKISLDDFGTGYSSLSYLEKLPLNTVKIDKSFLNDVKKGSTQARLLVSIIHMAHDLGYKVVAEGVEEKDQFELLREFNCDMIQGYLISKPLPSQSALDFLQKFTGQID
ncbi:putative two-component sensor protein [Leptospira ryugenii]|uniref:Putative two-component sensor protein n=1 Tax=Leptospira ryugenii TaxID=1917863 RepID=A0A2P2DWX4_9LEPT|nr:EAL domain-containing protein [Leptospira ryugenii]GBF49127.1 putative two-component sensor protein [Leptospira ryugenii]